MRHHRLVAHHVLHVGVRVGDSDRARPRCSGIWVCAAWRRCLPMGLALPVLTRPSITYAPTGTGARNAAVQIGPAYPSDPISVSKLCRSRRVD